MPDGPRHVAQHLTTPNCPNSTKMAGEVAELRLRGLGDVANVGCLPIMSAYSLADIRRDK